MTRQILRAITVAASFACVPAMSGAEPAHGIAMYGEPALAPGFEALPYANPNAPKGGKAVFGEVGSFDSLNPHIRKGTVPWQLRFLAYESLLGRSYDEPFTLYGVLAETVEADPGGMWVEFHLNPAAAFSDGSPVTVEDVIWSYETLGTIGHPRYLGSWEQVASIEPVGERGIRLTFNEANRELALIMGLRPILKKAQWEGKDFAESGLEPPISSAPYVIDDFEAGRFVSLARNDAYWGAELGFRKGTNNIDEIRMEFYGDAGVLFEAFKGGALTALRETNAQKWDEQYTFPAIEDGSIVKSLIPHERPSGIVGFVMNTRRDIFKDWRVRDGLIHAFNFEFINRTINGDGLPRITSYFSNSVLGMEDGPAEAKVRALLEPFAADLLPGALDGYALPVADGGERNRANIQTAEALFAEAGWTVQEGVMKNDAGEPFTFEILLDTGSAETEAIANIYVDALKRLGITPTIARADAAQMTERTDVYDFDMTYYRRGLSLSPGNEQRFYWGTAGVEEPGTRNWMGMASPAAEAMIDAMLNAPSQEDYVAAVRALDRVLTTGRYVIPLWHQPISFLAHDAKLKYPENLPIYGDWIGFLPDVWWMEE